MRVYVVEEEKSYELRGDGWYPFGTGDTGGEGGETGGSDLPAKPISSTTKVLLLKMGKLSFGDYLPEFTNDNNGGFLRNIGGKWEIEVMSSFEDGEY
jgi:hypothetical protein